MFKKRKVRKVLFSLRLQNLATFAVKKLNIKACLPERSRRPQSNSANKGDNFCRAPCVSFDFAQEDKLWAKKKTEAFASVFFLLEFGI
jgi:hypothetical protein